MGFLVRLFVLLSFGIVIESFPDRFLYGNSLLLWIGEKYGLDRNFGRGKCRAD